MNADDREVRGLPGWLRGRIPELDGLRGIAIAMVVTHHYVLEPIQAPRETWLYYVQASGRLAWSGLDLFFVLSGFLIGGILLDARDSSNYFRVFYTRRFFRIVPVYAVLLFLAFSVFLLGSVGAGNRFTWLFQGRLSWVPYLVFLQNFWMVKVNTLGPAILGLTWTLAVEEQFYLTLPLFVRFLSPRHLVFILVGGIFAAPILRVAVHVLWPTHVLAWYVLMPCRADALLLGVLGAVALRNPRWRLKLQQNRRALLCALVVLAFGFVVLTKLWGAPGFGVLTGGLSWLALFYLCVLLYAVVYKDSWLSRYLRWRWLMWLGSIAYGVYLFHQFVAYVLFAAVWGGPPGPLSWSRLCVSLSAFVVTLILCRLSWVYFEKPIVQAGHKANYEWRTGRER